jgi:hypothetical protein
VFAQKIFCHFRIFLVRPKIQDVFYQKCNPCVDILYYTSWTPYNDIDMIAVEVPISTKLHLSTIQENVILVVGSNVLHHTAHNNIDMFTIDVYQKKSDLVEKYLLPPKIGGDF